MRPFGIFIRLVVAVVAAIVFFSCADSEARRARMRAKISEIVSENKDFYLDFIG